MTGKNAGGGMKFPQLNPGSWLGCYYMEVQSGMSMASMMNIFFTFTTLWAVASDRIVVIFPWMTYPLFFCAMVLIIFGVLPAVHYVFLLKTTTAFLSEQRAKHNNPEMDLIRTIDQRTLVIMKKLGIDEKEGGDLR